MNKAGKNKKVFIIFYLIIIHLILGTLIFDKFFPLLPREKTKETAVIPLSTPVQIPYDSNSDLPNITNQAQTNNNTPTPEINQNTNSQPPVVQQDSNKLMIPVAGIKKENLIDTFSDARSENRVHNAIDIPAPPGTPVVAAADGEIARFFDSELGGITIYQFSKDKKFIYYYAHLQKRADNLAEKTFVPQGKIIGYVGDTGNAGAGNFHLHFSISIPNDEKKYWEGENVNPYLFLKDGIDGQIR